MERNETKRLMMGARGVGDDDRSGREKDKERKLTEVKKAEKKAIEE